MNLPELWSSTSLERKAVLTHRTGFLYLDKPFVLIEGHPGAWAGLQNHAVETLVASRANQVRKLVKIRFNRSE